jgi:hypothetical protein
MVDSSRQDGLLVDLRVSKGRANGLGGFTKVLFGAIMVPGEGESFALRSLF